MDFIKSSVTRVARSVKAMATGVVEEDVVSIVDVAATAVKVVVKAVGVVVVVEECLPDPVEVKSPKRSIGDTVLGL